MSTKANTITNQPFGLSIEITWILSLCIPIIIAVTGWIIVYLLNNRHMNKEKRIITKIQSFDILKESLNNSIIIGTKFYNYITYKIISFERLLPESNFYDFDKDILMKDYHEENFNKLKSDFDKSFLEFLYTWEQYEIVFAEYSSQKCALGIEYNELSKKITETWGYYNSYIYCVSSSTPISSDMRNTLILSSKELIHWLMEFTECMRDVNKNIQNFVFGDIFNRKNEKRIPSNSSWLTIDTLIEKHQDEIKNYYKITVKMPKNKSRKKKAEKNASPL
jgi:hypothetical protein